MRKIYFLLFLLFTFITGNAQSLENFSIKNKKTADSLVKVGEALQTDGKYAASNEYFEKCLVFYEKNRNFKEVGDCYSFISNTFYYQGDYNQSLEYSEKSLVHYKKVKNNKAISSTLNNIGGVYYYLGDYPKALEYFKNTLIYQEKLGDESVITPTIQNIGSIYIKTGDYQNALLYITKASKSFLKLNDQQGIARNLNAFGYIYIMTNDYKKAEKNIIKAYEIAKKIESKQLLIEVLYNFGDLYFKLKEYQKSLTYYNLCLKYSIEINSLQYKTESKVAIGNIQNKLGKYAKAISQCKEGLKMAEKLGSVFVQKEACSCLYAGYKSTGNLSLALYFHEQSSILQDSLKSKETSYQVMNMEFDNKKALDSLSNVQKQNTVRLKNEEVVAEKEKQRNIVLISLGLILLLAAGLWSRLRFVKKSKNSLQIEKDRSEKLLLNILPEEIAEELKEKGSVVARDFDLATILFTDFKSFTQTSEQMSPQDLVEEINICFKAFDLIVEKYDIEKIKTIGDAYMAAGGVPVPDEKSLLNIVLAGLEMQKFVKVRKRENESLHKPAFEMRLGIHAGPIIAGIVGIKKFQYDIWGNTVNIASRLESNGIVGKVNVSETIYDYLKNNETLAFEYRGKIEVKGKGEINMYFVEYKV